MNVLLQSYLLEISSGILLGTSSSKKISRNIKNQCAECV